MTKSVLSAIDKNNPEKLMKREFIDIAKKEFERNMGELRKIIASGVRKQKVWQSISNPWTGNQVFDKDGRIVYTEAIDENGRKFYIAVTTLTLDENNVNSKVTTFFYPETREVELAYYDDCQSLSRTLHFKLDRSGDIIEISIEKGISKNYDSPLEKFEDIGTIKLQ